MSFHLLACISAHGYGHFAMTAPILNEFNKHSSVSLTVRCALPEALIRSRIEGDFKIISESSDFGILMNSSLSADLAKTAVAYQTLHENFPKAIEEEKQKLLSYKPDLILANIPYLTIAAAKQANIPVIAYCSLNWAEIFKSYFKDQFPDANKIYREMSDAYNLADCFVRPAPSMAMPSLTNVRHIGPVAKISKNAESCRATINQQFSLSGNDKLVIISPGGVATPVPVNDWPVLPGVIWVTAWPYESQRQDVLSIDQLDVSFNDLLACSDAVITKPGYGTVSETACNGVPVLYVLRGDWAEEPFLEAWWNIHATVLKISQEDFFSGNLQAHLETLWRLPQSQKVEATGVQELVAMVNSYIN
jgi:hypothetical protein